ncbi:MAG TPA: sigma-70 family RNA polymerase sigma factor [Anaerolineaceae bacterium]
MSKNIDMKNSGAGREISLQALKAGDRAEFAALVERYSPQIYRLALKILNNTQDAEDVLQDTFIKALHALPEFEGRSSISTWLYRIAVNEALMLVRKRKPGEVSIDEEKEDEQGESDPVEIVDWCCLPESDLQSAESRAFLSQAVEKLTPTLRTVFVLRDVEGLSVRETAEALGITEATVKIRLLRARLKLREELSVYFAERVSERSVK